MEFGEYGYIEQIIMVYWLGSGGVGGGGEKEFIGYLKFYIIFVKLIDMQIFIFKV